MPFSVRASGDYYLVVNSETGKVMGRHKSKPKAMAQLRALYANVPEARRNKKKR